MDATLGAVVDTADAPGEGLGGAPDIGAPCPAAPPGPRSYGTADRLARKLLRIQDSEPGTDVYNLFSSSMVLSGTRCLLSYIIFPVLAPWLGALPVVGPAIGLPVGLAALVFDVRAVRRFFQSNHRWRWPAAAVYFVVMCMVAGLVGSDIAQLA